MGGGDVQRAEGVLRELIGLQAGVEQEAGDVCGVIGGDFIPPHYLLHVTRLNTSELEMSVLDYDWLKTLVKEKPKSVAHLWIAESDGKSRLVLTADTAELQAFVLKHVADTNAFKPALSMRRR